MKKRVTHKLRNRIDRRAMEFGENLMPGDVVDLIGDIHEYSKEAIIALIIDIMESCGFCCDREEAEFYW